LRLRPAIITPLLLATLALGSAAVARDYEFDRVHSQVSFELSHQGFSMSQGRFKGLSGGFSFNPKHWDKSTCDVHIDVRSVDMGDVAWSKKLLSKDWFDSARHPEIRFVCTRMEQTDDQHGKLHGELSLLGVSRPVTLDVTMNRIGMDKYALQHTAGFSATTRIRRSEFGMQRFIPDIGDEVNIRIEIEGPRRKD